MSISEIYQNTPDGLRNYRSGAVVRGGLVDWPSSANTGWAATGTTLTDYAGTHFITEPTVISDKRIDFVDHALFIRAAVRIERCEVNCFIDVDGGSLEIVDSNVNCPPLSNPAIGYSNLDIRRCDIRGGQHSVLGSNNTTVIDSILHEQFNDPEAADGYHNNSYISNGGSNVLIKHCTLDCSTALTPNNGGPTGDASIFGDFGPLTHFTFENNLFMETTGSYGLSAGWNPGKPYGDNPTYIVVKDNVFERGSTGHNGASGPVTSFKVSGVGNVWRNNRYDDDTLIGPDGSELT